jgi:hypothetical protein
VSLVLTFVGVSVAIGVLLLAASIILQPYLYSEAADRLPLRAAVGGLILGAFLTFWAYVNTRADHPDKYGTLFEFSPTGTKDVTEFEAVRRVNQKGPDGQWKEQTVAFKRVNGRNGAEFVETGDPTQKYQLNTASYMTIAVVVPEAGGAKTRFDAELDSRGQAYKSGAEKVYREKGSKRYVELGLPSTIYSPSTTAALLALLLNFLHFALWFAVLWPVMRYGSGAALGGAAALGLVTMLAVMPLLFNSNRPPATAAVTQ